jgi:ferredoxin
MKIDKMKCLQNHHCSAIGICPEKAISQINGYFPVLDNNKCTECGHCFDLCIRGAISFLK